MKKLSIAIGFIATLTLSGVSICGQTREDILNQITAKRAEILKLEDAFLSPSEDD